PASPAAIASGASTASMVRARAPSTLRARLPRWPSHTTSGSFATNARQAPTANAAAATLPPVALSAAPSGASSWKYAPCSRGNRLRAMRLQDPTGAAAALAHLREQRVSLGRVEAAQRREHDVLLELEVSRHLERDRLDEQGQ